MSKKSVQSTKSKILQKVKSKGDITEYRLITNGLTILYAHRPNTGVVTSDIVYFVGSRDEARGETGIAHMLEHMLFKPTTFDIERNIDSGAMQFERETGILINANTWKDRTSYYFSYPKEHFDRALLVEAERMHGVVLTDETLKPEQTNVLSEFDMYAGDEFSTLSSEMYDIAFRSHTYGHDTIGYREDIEGFTAEKLQSFYKLYYTPNNATLIIVGDVSEEEMERAVLSHFKQIPKGPECPRLTIREPKQEGVRTTTLSKPSVKQILGVGIKHAAFPTEEWFETMVIFDMLAGGNDSVLYKNFIDTGLLSNISVSLEESREQNLGIFFLMLTPKTSHEKMYQAFKKTVHALTPKDISPYLKKTIAKLLMNECLSRENSMSFTAELVEYASAHVWEHFYDSEVILKSITPQSVKKRMDALFLDRNTTLGYFIGTK